MKSVSIHLPGLRIVSTANLREHWAVRAKRAKAHRMAALVVPKFQLPCTVTLVRIAPRMLDAHDNLKSGCKNLVDGIADRLGVKDNDPRVEWRYRQERGEPKQYAVHVILESAG